MKNNHLKGGITYFIFPFKKGEKYFADSHKRVPLH